MLDQYELYHYVVIEGDPPAPTLEILGAWLAKREAQAMTERMWVYKARLTADAASREERKELSRAMMNVEPTENQPPFRIHFLQPNGSGAFSYKLPSISTSGDDRIGTIGWGT